MDDTNNESRYMKLVENMRNSASANRKGGSVRMNRWMVAAVAGAAVLSVAGVGQAQILGSAHDFSEANWNTTGTACGACHTPHNAVVPQIVPLWNHATDGSAGFTVYANSQYSGSLNATDVSQPSGASLACLSCHDGVVAVDSYDGVAGSTFIGDINPDANLGKDLSNDHPISFTYDDALAGLDGYLRLPSTATIDASVPQLGGKTVGEALLKGQNHDRMECTSCHDPHGQKGTLSLPSSGSMFVVIDGPKYSGFDKSLLCLQCHIK
jgi:hypothetical protein